MQNGGGGGDDIAVENDRNAPQARFQNRTCERGDFASAKAPQHLQRVGAKGIVQRKASLDDIALA